MNEKSTNTEGGSTTQVNLSSPSRQASIEDVEETKEHGTDNDEEEEESSEAEMGELDQIHKKTRTLTDHKSLERLKDDWNAPIYAFFHPVPTIGYEKGRHYHEFKCFASQCTKGVHRYLDKQDVKLTSNLHKHARLCWGANTVKLATEAGIVESACQTLSKSKDGSIAAAFEIKGKGKVKYSHRQHTKAQTW